MYSIYNYQYLIKLCIWYFEYKESLSNNKYISYIRNSNFKLIIIKISIKKILSLNKLIINNNDNNIFININKLN